MSARRKPRPGEILQAQIHPAHYLIQWERVLRWRERTQVSMQTGDEPFDFLAVLFASILQMRDWLIASRPDLRADIRGLFRDSGNLGLARDVANGSKHMILTSWSAERAACIAREYAGAGRVHHVIPRAGGRNLDALPLADACLEEIGTFMASNALL